MLCVRVLQAVNLHPTATSNTVNPLARVCLQLPGPGYHISNYSLVGPGGNSTHVGRYATNPAGERTLSYARPAADG